MNTENKILLWLDDQRDPMYDNWVVDYSPITNPTIVWVKSYKEYVRWITDNGLPTAICFDHDLADISYNPAFCQTIIVHHEKTGYDCCKWLVDYCIDNDKKLPLWNIQSANTVGSENIRMYLTNAKKHLKI